ncbi:MAG: UDP-N-acetylmuramate-L-alanine ligase [Candidatus Curtissbacteria bacterium GW2011_GWA1_41_11]|uniref:UDP-N-acetylmuramate-L-alanine ligase n=1 Tax=Candidatus Curtissbacteria bacterium GW2011_GWA1_41_11 TaxID=1618409 RepID=A0A0G0XK68_9BACT|nr:MAG: UDP-N-acetylmuramate-L-alanine ligase [Candidatus Curtissbacteria bacterium GW2011_GWA1_41_11]
MRKVAAIVLAAGVGKRMKSKTSKILHKIAGKPMILRTIDNLQALDLGQIIIVASPKNVNQLKKMLPDKITLAIQQEPEGTADAAQKGLEKVKEGINTVLVVNGDDSAFYKPETIKRVIKHHIDTNSTQTFLSVNVKNPYGLGRIIRDGDQVLAIVEEKEATAEQKKIKIINAGLYVFKKDWLQDNLYKVKRSTVGGEKYLVDLVEVAINSGQKVSSYTLKDQRQWHGINTAAELKFANEKFNKKIHIMGIGGAGASAAAGIAKACGYDVSGCDLNPHSSYTKNSKLTVKKGHDALHLHNIAMLIVSPAVVKNDPHNQELVEAKKQNIPILAWQEFQGKFLQKNKFVISVAGGYGKSTTTAMISQVLATCGLDPTCEVGATVLDWGKNYKVGRSKYYVNEADEYADNFLSYRPDVAVILNVAWDHPDYFKNQELLEKSYQKFINNIKKDGILIISDEKSLTDLAKSSRKDLKVVKVEDFKIKKLSIIGEFRKINALVALTVAKLLKLDIDRAKKSVQNFKGVARRLELKGKIGSAVVFDDYAVQPYTMVTTANALKARYGGKKVVLVFEPHTFSRINVFFDDFVSSFKKTNVDSILITDVFAAREKGDKQKLSMKLVKSVGKKAVYAGSVENSASYLKKRIKDFDVILSMGAGDVYKLYDLLKVRKS